MLLSEHKVLYLGTDPTRWKAEGKTLVHYPIIETKRIVQTLPSDAEEYSHLLFTSPKAVYHFFEIATFSLQERSVLSIGPGTKNALEKRGVFSIEAKEPTQEGIIALLREMDDTSLFWPHSKKSRKEIQTYLEKTKVKYRALAIYDTFTKKQEPLPNLKEFSEIIFTSPSTVFAFLEVFKTFPKNITYTPIGPITEKCLHAMIHPF